MHLSDIIGWSIVGALALLFFVIIYPAKKNHDYDYDDYR
jgi:membrane-associated phospholipid phosphatase